MLGITTGRGRGDSSSKSVDGVWYMSRVGFIRLNAHGLSLSKHSSKLIVKRARRLPALQPSQFEYLQATTPMREGDISRGI